MMVASTTTTMESLVEHVNGSNGHAEGCIVNNVNNVSTFVYHRGGP